MLLTSKKRGRAGGRGLTHSSFLRPSRPYRAAKRRTNGELGKRQRGREGTDATDRGTATGRGGRRGEEDGVTKKREPTNLPLNLHCCWHKRVFSFFFLLSPSSSSSSSECRSNHSGRGSGNALTYQIANWTRRDRKRRKGEQEQEGGREKNVFPLSLVLSARDERERKMPLLPGQEEGLFRPRLRLRPRLRQGHQLSPFCFQGVERKEAGKEGLFGSCRMLPALLFHKCASTLRLLLFCRVLYSPTS